MPESSRSIAKKAGAAAVERAFESVMPELFRRLDRIDQRIAGLERDMHERFGAADREMHGLRDHIDTQFQRLRDEMNELGQRVIRLEGRLEEIVRVIEHQNLRIDRQSDKMDQWIERLVRLEMTRGTRRGKKAS